MAANTAMTSARKEWDGNSGGNSVWNSNVALFSIAVATGSCRRWPAMATRGAYFWIDCRGCVRRLYRLLRFVGLSLHFAARDKRHVPAHPDQLRANRGLRFFSRPLRTSLSKPCGTDRSQSHGGRRVYLPRLHHSEIREAERTT